MLQTVVRICAHRSDHDCQRGVSNNARARHAITSAKYLAPESPKSTPLPHSSLTTPRRSRRAPIHCHAETAGSRDISARRAAMVRHDHVNPFRGESFADHDNSPRQRALDVTVTRRSVRHRQGFLKILFTTNNLVGGVCRATTRSSPATTACIPHGGRHADHRAQPTNTGSCWRNFQGNDDGRPGAAASQPFVMPQPPDRGQCVNVTVNAKDPFNNIATRSRTSRSAAQRSFLADYTFTAATRAFMFSRCIDSKTAGSPITVGSAGCSNGLQNGIVVPAAAGVHSQSAVHIFILRW